MKNKLVKIFFYLLIITNFFLKNLHSEEFEFTATELQVLNEGTLLIGKDDVKIISDNQIIKAKKFKYNKNNLHLELIGSIEIINDLDNTIINAEKIDYFIRLDLYTVLPFSFIAVRTDFLLSSCLHDTCTQPESGIPGV